MVSKALPKDGLPDAERLAPNTSDTLFNKKGSWPTNRTMKNWRNEGEKEEGVSWLQRDAGLWTQNNSLFRSTNHYFVIFRLMNFEMPFLETD